MLGFHCVKKFICGVHFNSPPVVIDGPNIGFKARPCNKVFTCNRVINYRILSPASLNRP